MLIWTAAGGAVAVPNATTAVAGFLRIDRGTDLVLHCAVLAGRVGFLFVYRTIRSLEGQLTLLVRQMELDEVKITSLSHNEQLEQPQPSNEFSKRE